MENSLPTRNEIRSHLYTQKDTAIEPASMEEIGKKAIQNLARLQDDAALETKDLLSVSKTLAEFAYGSKLNKLSDAESTDQAYEVIESLFQKAKEVDVCTVKHPESSSQ